MKRSSRPFFDTDSGLAPGEVPPIATEQPRRRFGALTIVVVFALLTATVVAALVAQVRLESEERSTLEAELARFEATAARGVADVRVVLDRAVGVLQVSDRDADVFSATPIDVERGILRGLAVVRLIDGARVASTIHGNVDGIADLDPVDFDIGDSPEDGMRIFSFDTIGGLAVGRVGVVVPGTGDPRLVVAEIGIPLSLGLGLGPSMDFAVFFGDEADPNAVFFSSNPDAHVGSPRVTDDVLIGGDTWRFVLGGDSPLGLARYIPWLVLVIGFVITGGSGTAVEAMRRRQYRAASLSARNIELDRALEELRLSQARYRDIVNATQAGLFLVDMAHDQITPLNAAAAVYTGEGPKHITAMFDLIHPDMRMEPQEWLNRFFHGDQDRTAVLELRMRVEPDRYQWTQAQVVVLRRDEEGRPAALLTTLTNITTLVEESRAAEATAADLGAIWAAARTGLVMLDSERRIISANPAFLQISRADSLDRILGLSLGEVLTPADRSVEAVRQQVQHQISSGPTALPSLLRVRRIDDEEVWIELSAARVSDPASEPRWVIVVSDVTERTNLNRQLEQTVEEVSAVLGAAGYPLLILDVENRITEANVQATETFLWEHSALRGMPFGDLLEPEFRWHFLPGGAALTGTAAGTADVTADDWTERLLDSRLDMVCRRRDGTVFPVEAVVSIIPGSDATRRYVVTVIDQTEHKQTEARMIQVQKHEVLATVVAGVAHDFNNLLTAIGGSLQLLHREIGDDNRWLNNAESSTTRAGSLVRELLQFSRRDEPQRTAVDLRALAQGVFDLAVETFDRRIEFTSSWDPSIDYGVYADPAQIEQVILNLMTNARDAVLRDIDDSDPATRTPPRIACTMARVPHPDGDVIELTIADNGHGIPAEAVGRVFDPFFTTKPPGEGTGLGLASAFGVVAAHGGTIDVVPTPSPGTTFRVWLPSREALSLFEESTTEAVPAAEAALVTPNVGLRLLVADDEAQVLEFMIETLVTAGHDVTAVTDGDAAIRRATTDAFDLILLDINMPGRNGWEALREIRQVPDAPPIILISGHAHAADARARGAVLLPKPFTAQGLVQAVADLRADHLSAIGTAQEPDTSCASG